MSETQMSIFNDEADSDLPILDLDAGREEKEQIEKPELLTIKLFKQVIRETEGNQTDELLARFAEFVLPNLIRHLVGATAKGGQFTEDRREKLFNYQKLPSLQEYVLVSQSEMQVELYRKDTDGKWLVQSLRAGDTLHLGSIDLAIALSEIYEDVEF